MDNLFKILAPICATKKSNEENLKFIWEIEGEGIYAGNKKIMIRYKCNIRGNNIINVNHSKFKKFEVVSKDLYTEIEKDSRDIICPQPQFHRLFRNFYEDWDATPHVAVPWVSDTLDDLKLCPKNINYVEFEGRIFERDLLIKAFTFYKKMGERMVKILFRKDNNCDYVYFTDEGKKDLILWFTENLPENTEYFVLSE
jgi:hypothetical protein